MQQFTDEQQAKIDSIQKKDAEELIKTLATNYGLPYINLFATPINLDALRTIPKDVAIDAKMGPFNLVNKKLFIAILSPNNDKTKKVLEDLSSKGYVATIFMTSEDSLRKVWDRYDDLSQSKASAAGSISISDDSIIGFKDKIKNLADAMTLFSELAQSEDANKASQIIELMLGGALALNVSDLHIEPEDKDVILRYRLDGVLTEVASFSHKTHDHIMSRIKLVSGMKLNLHIAQDGRFSIKAGGVEIEIRSSVIPTNYGESAVLRVLNPNSINVKLESIGMHPRLLETIKKEISKPNGMLLNTGPTGSGKTTSLYAFLKYVLTPDVKILTIENPVEYHLEGIVQTQTDEKKGYTFLAGLRAALRQDPDIIMVGEIRDKETASVAINAALTGHLVLSTLHTNNAAGTYPRLIDLGINPKVITSAITVSMAQRLLRKLCENCKEEKVIEEDRAVVDKILESIKDKTYLDGIQTEKMWVAKGCEVCNSTGYKGRTGAYEAILSTREVEAAINNNPSESEIWEAAAPQNILNMQQDAIIKMLSGITSIEEIRRVIEID